MRTSTVEYEIERVRLGRHLSRSAVRQLLTDQAEYGGWELTRLRRYRDGTRDVWIRRKIIRVVGGRGRYGPTHATGSGSAKGVGSAGDVVEGGDDLGR